MNYIPLRSFDDYHEANVVLGMLQDRGINCHIKDENVGPILSQIIGGVKLMVFDLQAKKAWKVMEEAEKKYIQTIACPICKTHSLKAITITKNFRTVLGALGSMLLNGRPVEVKRKYKCTSCGYDFKELPR